MPVQSSSTSICYWFIQHSLCTVRCLQPRQIHKLYENVRPAVPPQSVETKFLHRQMWQNSPVCRRPSTASAHKIKSLGAILNFKQFCVWNTSNLRWSPRPEKSRKRRIIIDSGSDICSLKWAFYRLRKLSLKTLIFAEKTSLASVRNFNQFLQSSAQLCVFHAWLRFCLT